eukprot:3794419-Prorocentrum_lima.AAC.1
MADFVLSPATPLSPTNVDRAEERRDALRSSLDFQRAAKKLEAATDDPLQHARELREQQRASDADARRRRLQEKREEAAS